MPGQIKVSREELSARYLELLDQNPLLSRTELELKAINWTNEEIRTMQLLLACASNASLKQYSEHLEKELEGRSKIV